MQFPAGGGKSLSAEKSRVKGSVRGLCAFLLPGGAGAAASPPAPCTGAAAARCPSRGPILVPSVGGMQPRAAFPDFSCSYRLPVSATPSRTGSWSRPAGVCEQRWGQPGANLPGEAKPWSCWPRPMACQGAFLPARSRRVLPGGNIPGRGQMLAARNLPRCSGVRGEALSRCCSDLSRQKQMKMKWRKTCGYFLDRKSRL